MKQLFKNPILTATGRTLSCALLAAIVASCASINHLRDAQSAFNEAATAELKATFDTTTAMEDASTSDLLGNWANARAGYGSALLSLDRITAKDENTLKTEKLWGAKLALEALCHWKLGDYEQATQTAKEAQKTDQLFPRDRALMAALPGLVMTDYAYDLLTASPQPVPGSADLTNLVHKASALLIGPDGAIAVIQAARSVDIVEAEHPVHVFLLQAQLAAYRNYRKAFERLDQRGVPLTNAVHIAAQVQLDELAKRVSGPGGEKIVDFWVERDHLQRRPAGGSQP